MRATVVATILVLAVVVPAGATRALGPCYAAGWRGGQEGSEVAVGQSVEDVAATAGWVWALGDRSVTRIDRATRAATGRATVDAASTGRLVTVGDDLWVTGKGPGSTDPGAAAPRLWRIDGSRLTATATVDLGAVGDDLAAVVPAPVGDRPGLWALVRRAGSAGDRLDLVWVDGATATSTTTDVGEVGDDHLPGSPWVDGVGLATDGGARAWVEAADRIWRVERDAAGLVVTDLAGGGRSAPNLGGLTWLGGALFAVSDGSEVVRIDPVGGATTARTALPAPAAGRVRALADHLWVDTTAGLVDVDPSANVVGAVAGSAPTTGAAAGDGAVWVTTFRLDVASRFDRQRDNRLLRVDPASAAVTGTWVPGCAPGAAVVVGGAVWMASYPASAVLVVDP